MKTVPGIEGEEPSGKTGVQGLIQEEAQKESARFGWWSERREAWQSYPV